MLVRRSNLFVSPIDEDAVARALVSGADAITFDLGDLVEESRKGEAQRRLHEAIARVAPGSAELFVRLSEENLTEDLSISLESSALTGIVVPNFEGHQVSTSLNGALEVIASVRSAPGVWNIKEIVKSSRRIRQCFLDEGALCASMGIVQEDGVDPLQYARGRVVNECIAFDVQPVGLPYELRRYPRGLALDEVRARMIDMRNLGFKGVVCRDPNWIAAANAAFSPTPEQVVYAKRVREAFAEGVSRGTAAVPLDGRMVDAPVDKAAAATLELATACASRDRAKLEAIASGGA
jgi:citrate lyase subunit beta / citryl-CoA lyase